MAKTKTVSRRKPVHVAKKATATQIRKSLNIKTRKRRSDAGKPKPRRSFSTDWNIPASTPLVVFNVIEDADNLESKLARLSGEARYFFACISKSIPRSATDLALSITSYDTNVFTTCANSSKKACLCCTAQRAYHALIELSANDLVKHGPMHHNSGITTPTWLDAS